MNNAKWIWCKTKLNKDNYAEFKSEFSYNGKTAILNIACDGICAVYLNGNLVFFTQCADFPHYKFYDKIDLTSFCKPKNELLVKVWHLGDNSQVYINDDAGVIYSVEQDGKAILSSNENTLSREMNEYKNGYAKKITGQLGFSFYYDNTAKKSEFDKSVLVSKTEDLHLRGIKALSLCERLPFKIIKTDKSVIVDMQKEVAGFIDVDVESEEEQDLLFTYGEHLADGKVRRLIDNRDFSFEIKVAKGKNTYLNPFRRVAGRYVEIFSKSPLKINYVGIRPVIYPVIEKPYRINDELLQKIYDTSVYTLNCCMHEHYEDCPWREQALYTMDSRNQMLCGYYAFKGFDYQRHTLVLISKSIRADGLLSICAPSGSDVPIPFFSLMYIKEVCEYVKYSGDKEILNEVGDTIEKIIKTFTERIDESGLIISFPYPYWNFYEWAEESDNGWQILRGKDDSYTPSYDLILNAAFVHVLEIYSETTGKKFELKDLKEKIKEKFYKNGVFKLSSVTEKTSELGNAVALLIGLGDESLARRIADNGKTHEMIKATLSMKTFVYDALLKTDKKYKDFILNDIKSVYSKMLDAGATTFWETDLGEADFGGAGSLCHGWSAIPVYYLHKLLDK